MKMQAMVLRRHGGPEVLDRETIDIGAVAPRRVPVSRSARYMPRR